MLTDTRLTSDFAHLLPRGRLSDLVDAIYGYRETHAGPVWHRGLPGAGLTFIIGVGAPVDVTMDGFAGEQDQGPAEGGARFRAFVGGLHRQAARVEHIGHQHGVQVQLRPEAAPQVLGVPAGTLAGTVVELDDLVGRTRTQRLCARVAEAPTLRGAAHAVGEELTASARQAEAPGPRPELGHLVGVLERSDGRARVEDVAAELGWSRRHLTRLTTRAFGVGPKTLARLVRFQRVTVALGSNRPLATIAAQHGFSDQAHLTREVTALAGAAPSQLRHEFAVGGSVAL